MRSSTLLCSFTLFTIGFTFWFSVPVANAVQLKQIEAFSLDFDDNTISTSAKIYIWDTQKKKEVPISTANWALIREKIGKRGPWKRFILTPESMRDFNDDSPEGLAIVRRQVEEALDRGDDSVMGMSLTALAEAMNSPRRLKYIYIITARSNSPGAVQIAFQVLKERGIIARVPLLKNIFCVGWPGHPAHLRGADNAESKGKVIMHILDEIEQEPMPKNATWVENPDGTGQEKLHLFGFSDDDFGNNRKAWQVLSKEVARGRWPHIKTVLLFTGENNPDENPRAEVIRSDGTLRPTKRVEGTRMRPSRKIMTRKEARKAYDDLVARVCGKKWLKRH